MNGRSLRAEDYSGRLQSFSIARASIERDVEVQRALIEGLLDFSGLITGRFDMKLAPVDLGALVGRIVADLVPVARRSGLTVAFVGGEGLLVTADARRVEQIVSNLLGNAMKFTAPGGRVAVGIRGTDRSVELTVRDTGRGIAASELPRLFDLHEHDGSDKGLGLGLYIVKRLTELQSGTVAAASDGLEKGATFTVTLPRVSG